MLEEIKVLRSRGVLCYASFFLHDIWRAGFIELECDSAVMRFSFAGF